MDNYSKNTKPSIIGLIQNIIKAKETKSKYSILLNDKTIEIINELIKTNPTLLGYIENYISEVIKDNKINSEDIPTFMVIVQKTYESLYSLKKLNFDKIIKTLGDILKFIIVVLVEENVINIDESKRPEFKIQMNILIDSCIELLSFTANLEKSGCCKKLFPCFY